LTTCWVKRGLLMEDAMLYRLERSAEGRVN
jgi:hypothetical protein